MSTEIGRMVTRSGVTVIRIERSDSSGLDQTDSEWTGEGIESPHDLWVGGHTVQTRVRSTQ